MSADWFSSGFYQRDISGGQSNDVAEVEWNGTNNTYLSLENLTVGETGFIYTDQSKPGYIVSNIYHIGENVAPAYFSYGASGKTVQFRGSDSIDGLKGAAWSEETQSGVTYFCGDSPKYVQFREKLIYSDGEYYFNILKSNPTFSIFNSYFSPKHFYFDGMVNDASTGKPVIGASVSVAGKSGLTDDGTTPNGKGGATMLPGEFEISGTYSVGQSNTIKVTKDGYESKSYSAEPVCNSNGSFELMDIKVKLDPIATASENETTNPPAQENVSSQQNSNPAPVEQNQGSADVPASTSQTSSALVTENDVSGSIGTSADSPSESDIADAQAIEKPEAISASDVELNNQKYPIADSSTFTEGQNITLSGKTTPNTKVTLYIYSRPTTVEVVSDTNGNWNYTLSNLEIGEHHVEAVVTDTSSNVSSDRVTIAKFSVLAKAAENNSKFTVNKNYYLIGSGIIIFLLIILGGLYWRKRVDEKAKSPLYH